MEARSLQFSTAVRALGSTARRLGLPVSPAFRSPPRAAGAERTLQRHRSGEATVAVRIKGRPWAAVLADMVEGVVAANELSVLDAAGVRAALWSALQLAGLAERTEPVAGVGTGGSVGAVPDAGSRRITAA